jgi:hypothetical protein
MEKHAQLNKHYLRSSFEIWFNEVVLLRHSGQEVTDYFEQKIG